MVSPEPERGVSDRAASVPTDLASAGEHAAEEVAQAADSVESSLETRSTLTLPPLRRWGGGYLSLVFLAQFVISIATLAPSTYSLAIRVQQMVPSDKDAMLSVVLTIPAVAIIVVSPIVGVLSDRTRSRLGRRRPWMIGGLVAGVVGLAIVGVAPDIPLVIVGWSVGYLGLIIAGGMMINHFGDALPENQRGKVAGINGAITQIGPIAGILLSGVLVQLPFLLFFVPGALALLGSVAFLVRMKDPSTKDAVFEHVSIGGVFARMVFNPRKHKDFAWVWISKAATFIALYLMSIYGVYFLSERLHLSQAAVAGLIATSGGIGILMTMVGALGSGFLSDRIRRRRVLVVIAGFVLAAGLIIIATTTSATQYIVGGLVFALGTGIFGAVDQALALDVLPDRVTPGRFLAINGLANEIPKAIAPVAAALLVGIGGGGQYQLVYFAGAVLAIAGGLLVIPVKSVR